MPKPAAVPSSLVGLTRAMAAGLCLIFLYFLTRTLVPATPEEAHRALLRLRGGLVLTAAAWYGRYILLPYARWRSPRWLYLPALLACLAAQWPFGPAARWLALAREAIVLAVSLSVVEQIGAVLRRAATAGLDGILARRSAACLIRRWAGVLSFLVALAAGVGLYLLAVDFLFDYFLYSLFGVVLVLAIHLAPLVLLASRLERAVAVRLDEIARREDAALAAGSPEALAAEEQARRTLVHSQRLGLLWWHWFHPLAGAALLLLAAVLYQWR